MHLEIKKLETLPIEGSQFLIFQIGKSKLDYRLVDGRITTYQVYVSEDEEHDDEDDYEDDYDMRCKYEVWEFGADDGDDIPLARGNTIEQLFNSLQKNNFIGWLPIPSSYSYEK